MKNASTSPASTRWQQLDLNLLRVLQAVYSTRHVTSAAQQLFMTQSAVSNALRRLRGHLGDPLFIRSRDGMHPTPLVEALAPTVIESLRQIDQSLSMSAQFDPAQSTRLFGFLTNDLAQMFFIPPLMQQLAQVAPGIRLETVDLSREEGQRAMDEGRVEFAIGNWPVLGPRCVRQKIFSEQFVVVLRKRHPLARKPRLLQRDYLQARHIDYRPGGESYDTLRSLLDGVIENRHPPRQIVLTAGYGLGLGALIAESDHLLTIPSRLAHGLLADNPGLVLRPLPFHIPPIDISIQWHSRSNHDAACIWMRDQLLSIFRSA